MDTMKQGPRLRISEGMQKFLDYPKFRGPTRLLLLQTNHPTCFYFERGWLYAAESLGWETAAVPSVVQGELHREDIHRLLSTIAEFKPDFVLSSNYAGMDTMGMFARYFEDARLPYVTCFTDTPRLLLREREVHCSYYTVAATWERAYIPYLHSRGFEHVHFMPLATDPGIFSGVPQETPDRDVAFVGGSILHFAAEAWAKVETFPVLRAAIVEAVQAGRVTRENYAQGLDAILPVSLVAELNDEAINCAELYLIYEPTRQLRADMVQRLHPYGVEVRGDEFWTLVTDRCGGNVDYVNDLAQFYSETAINLNTTSFQMLSAVNQRVFDAPAAGGFVLTDRQSDLDFFFDDDEIATYASLDELEDKVRYFLSHPRERYERALRTQRRVLAEDTHAHRLKELEIFLRERYA